MGQKCEKCQGEYDANKYCLNCKKAFCHEVNTTKLKKTAPKSFDVINVCPNCGSEEIVPIESELIYG